MSVVVLDFGSQYTQLIARRLRELRAFSVIVRGTAPWEDILAHRPQALVLSGSPASVVAPDAPRPDPRVFASALPILGICYGMHLLALAGGGRVVPGRAHEYGRAALVHGGTGLFAGLPQPLPVWTSHGDAVADPPPGWEVLGSTAECPIAALASPDGRRVGLQFHPEVAHTPHGKEVLGRFLDRAGVDRTWTPENVAERLVVEVRDRAQGGRVLLAASGGVDSSVLALLLVRAGVDHKAVFVDHGLLREGERDEVVAALRGLGVCLHVVDASDRFLRALRGIRDPEEKRRAIGATFIAVFREKAAELGPFRFLAQGTLYPDVIESGEGAGAAKIKSHHNVGGLPAELGFELLEPLRLLFKDEVREVGRVLGLPDSIRLRHPFPGPGLAVRVLGEVTPEALAILRRADHEFVSALREEGLYGEVWQALAVLLPVRTVGVTGDGRRYGHVVALRAVTSADGMTADWARLPPEFLDRVAARITRRVPAVGRVVYDITGKPPATIEWE
ncbi:MAG: glutamine-hydrolyzing GMP synthase [Candidatus Bipolaricaulota bacterium]|nr:glutamine-hydrolyzing GMP synthase [Candidatus Bipolaricaulota bacterium]